MRTRRGSRPRTPALLLFGGASVRGCSRRRLGPSITRQIARRSLAPHPLSELLRVGLGLIELVQAHKRHPRRDTREALAYQHNIRADAVTRDHIGEPALVDVKPLAVGFEPYPAMQHKAG